MRPYLDLFASIGACLVILGNRAAKVLWGVDLLSMDLEVALTAFAIAALARDRYMPSAKEAK